MIAWKRITRTMYFFEKTKALGTEIEIYLASEKAKDFKQDFHEIKKTITDFEKSFSRFLENSEISRLNKTVGSFSASAEMINVLLLARYYYRATKGIFDPTILPSLEDAGYKKSFFDVDFISSIDNKVSSATNDAKVEFGDILINEKENTIFMPEGAKIDLGGIGKGYIVDKIIEIIKSKGYENFWFSAGGDMFVSGSTEDGQPQLVGVQNPKDLEKNILQIEAPRQGIAIATSGIAKRHWIKDGQTKHHIIDPRTKTSAKNNLLAVTIVAEKVIEADIFAKTVFILGPEKGLDFINGRKNIEGLLIDKNNQITVSKNMNNYLIQNK